MGTITHVCEVTTGTASSRAGGARGTLRQWKDKQHHRPGMFRGQLHENKSLYAHGRIITAWRGCVCARAIITRRGGLRTSETAAPLRRRLGFPLARRLPARSSPFAPLILPDRTRNTDGSRQGCSHEIVPTVSRPLPSVPGVLFIRGHLGHLASRLTAS